MTQQNTISFLAQRWMALVAGLSVWMFPRAHGWSRRWQFWMPRAWRDALAKPPG